MSEVLNLEHGLAALLAVTLGLLALRPVCWWACSLLRELEQQGQAVSQSYSGRALLCLLLIFFLALGGMVFGLSYKTAAVTVFVLCVLVLAWIDAETGYLPDALTLPLLWLGLLLNVQAMFTSLELAVLGAAGAYVFLWLINAGFVVLRKKQGMGQGDFKLLAALGAWFGLTALPQLLLLSSLGSLLYALLLALTGRWHAGRYLHFGPYLAAAGLCQLFFLS